MAFTHPLNRRNPDSSLEQAREGKRESALAWGSWGLDYLFFRVQFVSKESVSGRQRDPEHTELGPAETRFCLPRAGCCGFDRLETRTWQKHRAFTLYKKLGLGGLFLAPLCFACTSLAIKLLLTISTHPANAVRKGKGCWWLPLSTDNPERKKKEDIVSPCWGSRDNDVRAPRDAQTIPQAG